MSLVKKGLSGTLWTASSSVIMSLIQILRLSILTRFLDKSDFGLVAIVILVLGFTHIFADLGVSVSLFSRKTITKKEYSSLYWVSLILGIFLYLFLLVITPFISSFYEQDILKQLIPIMGLDLIISTAGRQFRVFRQKALSFKNLAIIDISAATLSLSVAVIIAMKGGGVWSIIYSTLFASLLSTACLILTGLRTHPLSFYINLKEGRSFYKIGFYQTGSQILDYLASQLDIIIIGKVMDASSLGVYNLVKQLVSRVYLIVNPIVTNVAIPILATFQEQLDLLKKQYLHMINIVSFINIGLYGLMAIVAKEVLLIMYGEDYVNAEFIFQILCIWGAFSAVGNVASTLVIVKGRTDLGFRWTVVRIIFNPFFVLLGSFWGLNGVVIGQAIYMAIFSGLYWKLLIKKILDITFKEYYLNILPYLLASLSGFVFLYVLSNLLGSRFDNIVFNIALYTLLFGFWYIYFNKNTLKSFIKFVNKEV